jgi:two-component system, response regulator PdtaR
MLKILVVEDDKFISAIISFFIKDLGHQLVGRCQTGTEALEVCKAEQPDVVLMDIHLEGEIDGIQTAEKMQRDFDLPVIFISSDTSTNVVERAIIANSYGYLVKPVQKKELGITIDLAYYKHKVDCDQKRREKSFRQFLADAPIPVVILQNERIQYLNMNALDLFHTHYIEDIIGLPFIDFVPADLRDSFQQALEEQASDKKKQVKFETMVTGLHGEPLDVLVKASSVQFNGKKALQLILADQTEEKVIRKSYCKIRQILQLSDDPVIMLNEEFVVTAANASFSSLLHGADTIIGKSYPEIEELGFPGLENLKELFDGGAEELNPINVRIGDSVFSGKLHIIGSRILNNLEAVIIISP